MDGYIRIGTEIDTKGFDAQIQQMEDKIEDLEYQLGQFEPNTKEYQDINVELEKAKNKLGDLVKKQNELNQKTGQVDFSNWTKKLTKVGFALISIRGAMGIISKASSTYLSQNEQTAQKMQAMWIALGNAIGPVIEIIANGILKLIGYLNVFVKTLSGGKIDLTKGMNANAKAVGGTSQAMEKLNKQLASFDEMNTLNDNKTSGGAGVGGVGGGSFEMPELNTKIVDKLKSMAEWLKKNWKWFGKVATAVALLIGSKALGSGLLGLGGIISGLATIGVIAIGVDLFYKALTGRDLLKDIGDIYNGFKELKKAKEEQEKVDKKLHEDTMQAIKDRKEEQASYEKGSQQVAQYIAVLESSIEMSLSDMRTRKNNKEAMKRAREEIDALIGNYKKLYDQGKLTEKQTQTYTNLMAVLGYRVDGTKMSAEEYQKALKNTGLTQKEINGLLNGTISEAEILGTVYTRTNKTVDEASKKSTILADSLTKLAKNVYNIKVDTTFNEPDTSKVTKAIDKMKNAINLSLSIFGGKVKMAKGGIVNNPGKGVPISSNIIAGESGREWVQPLDDPSSLELIGQAIGRYTTINATLINQMNGRIISRELQKVQNDSNFAYNR